jgi:CubicO group peptidase (beta-lactamase class C family)
LKLRAVLLAILPLALLANVQLFSAEDEALYLKRYEAQQKAALQGGGLPEYDPLEAVAGAKNARPLPQWKAMSLSDAVIKQATDYAGERNSSALIVWRRGKIEFEQYYGGFDQNKPIVSKSLAKPVTAILIGRAIQQGHIKSLDQPVADFITEWKGDASRKKMLIRHLLDMRSGLLPQGEGKGPEDVLNRAYLHPRHDEVIIREYPLTHEPGSRYEYANATSELVAPVIERATGKRYGAYLSEALLKPLGAQGGSVWVNRKGGTAHAGCCLLLPAQSWLRMAVLLAQDGMWNGKRLLPKGYVTAMRTPTAQNPHSGLGVYVAGKYVEWRGPLNPEITFGRTRHSEPYLDKDIYLFDGNSNQMVTIVPGAEIIVLRTGNNPPRDKAWDNAFLPNMLIREFMSKQREKMPEPQPR